MNSTAFTQNDIVLQLQLQSKPWKLLHTITDKTQVPFLHFAYGDFHPHLLASLTLISMKKKITVRLPGEKIYRGYYVAARRYKYYLLVLKVSLRSERSERVRNTFEKIKFVSPSGHVISSIYPARTGINFPYFQLARRSFRFPSQLVSQCHFSQLAQILHEEWVFCRVAPLGTPENNGRLHIIQKITKKSNDATQFAKLDS